MVTTQTDLALAEEVRGFNRFFTQQIGALDEDHEGLAVTLGESRTLFTIREMGEAQPGRMAEQLDLDLAYTSRLIGKLEGANLVRRRVSSVDRRQRVVSLTPAGERLIAEIERRSNVRVVELLSHLSRAEIDELTDAMHTIQRLIDKKETQ